MAKRDSNIRVPFPKLPTCYEGVRVMHRNRDLFDLMGISPNEVWSEDVTGQFHRFVVSLDRIRDLEPISNFHITSDVSVVSQPGGGRVETRTLIIQSDSVKVVDTYSMIFDGECVRMGTSWTVSLFRRAGYSPRPQRASIWNRNCDEPHVAASRWRFVDVFCAFFD